MRLLFVLPSLLIIAAGGYAFINESENFSKALNNLKPRKTNASLGNLKKDSTIAQHQPFLFVEN